MADYEIKFQPYSKEEEAITLEGLKRHTRQVLAADCKTEPFSLLAYSAQSLIGSLIGKTFWNWLYVDLLWVSEENRKKWSRL